MKKEVNRKDYIVRNEKKSEEFDKEIDEDLRIQKEYIKLMELFNYAFENKHGKCYVKKFRNY